MNITMSLHGTTQLLSVKPFTHKVKISSVKNYNDKTVYVAIQSRRMKSIIEF